MYAPGPGPYLKTTVFLKQSPERVCERWCTHLAEDHRVGDLIGRRVHDHIHAAAQPRPRLLGRQRHRQVLLSKHSNGHTTSAAVHKVAGAWRHEGHRRHMADEMGSREACYRQRLADQNASPRPFSWLEETRGHDIFIGRFGSESSHLYILDLLQVIVLESMIWGVDGTFSLSTTKLSCRFLGLGGARGGRGERRTEGEEPGDEGRREGGGMLDGQCTCMIEREREGLELSRGCEAVAACGRLDSARRI